MLPKSRVPRELTAGLFSPEFMPVNVELNNFVKEAFVPARKLEAETSVSNRILRTPTNTNRIPIPLTEREAQEADRQIRNALQRIAAMREKLAYVRGRIDDAIDTNLNGKELSFRMDISKKPRIERAIKKLFGEKLDFISYPMYKQMLEAKSKLENREVEDYAKGKIR